MRMTFSMNRNLKLKLYVKIATVYNARAKAAAEPVPDNLLALASKDAEWKGWGEISYGGYKCVERAKAAEFLVRSWMEEVHPGTSSRIMSYIIELDSLKAISLENITFMPRGCEEIRLRMDGLFEEEKHAIGLTKEFTALYTNGPAGGGGIGMTHIIFSHFLSTAPTI